MLLLQNVDFVTILAWLLEQDWNDFWAYFCWFVCYGGVHLDS